MFFESSWKILFKENNIVSTYFHALFVGKLFMDFALD